MNFKKIFIIIALLFVVHHFSYSQIYIVKSFDYKNFNLIIEGIKAKLQKFNNGKITILNLKNILNYDIEDNEENVCFTLGEKAYKYILNHSKKIKIIALLIFDNSLYINNNRTIFINPLINLEERILLLKRVIVNLKGIIIPCSNDWYMKNHNSFEEKIKEKGIIVKFFIVSDDVGTSFEKLNVPENYIVLSVYDTKIYNQNNIFFIFRVIFEKKIPFVGFSIGFIKNGSFLAIEPDYYNMGLLSAEMLFQAINKEVYYIVNNEKYNVLVNNKLIDDYNFQIDFTKKEVRVIK